MELSNVADFGATDADADKLLREAFQDHPAYLDAKDHSRPLVVGRKGSGKTAIYRRLIQERSPTSFSFGHTFEDYPWAHHDLQAQSGTPEERRYVHSWRYLALMSLSKILLNQDQSQPWSEGAADALQALEEFVVDSYGTRDPDITQLFSPEKQLRFKGKLKIPVIELDGEMLRVRDLPIHAQHVNSVVAQAVVEALNPEIDYYVCFDQLDLGFSVDGEYPQRLIGLIIAARELNRAAREAGKKMSVIVFLRDDIYEMLQFEDKNKVTETAMSSLAWSVQGSEYTLRRLMELRFEAAFEEKGVRWQDVFDESKEMPSRQSKYQHICARTFLRPRDMIKFCNEVLAAYKRRVRGRDAETSFQNEDVHGAREAYSEYLLRELDDEIHKHVPEYREHLEVLKTLGGTQFTASAFSASWGRRLGTPKGRTAEEALRQLFEFSVIGYQKVGGSGGGSRFVWRYLDARARFNSEADTFRVHPGFKEALDLTLGSR